MKNLLIPVDLTSASNKVIEGVMSLIDCKSYKLWLLHITQEDPAFLGYGIGPEHERNWRSLEIKEDHKGIQQIARNLECSGFDATPLLVQGQVDTKILELANHLNADLIVMGVHRPDKLSDYLLGNIAKSILKKMNTPVLFVPV